LSSAHLDVQLCLKVVPNEATLRDLVKRLENLDLKYLEANKFFVSIAREKNTAHLSLSNIQ
jgi:hypothetical protein